MINRLFLLSLIAASLSRPSALPGERVILRLTAYETQAVTVELPPELDCDAAPSVVTWHAEVVCRVPEDAAPGRVWFRVGARSIVPVPDEIELPFDIDAPCVVPCWQTEWRVWQAFVRA